VNAAEKIEEWRQAMTDATMHFERVAVTQKQIEDWNLPSRPNKQTDTRTRGFEERFGTQESVELDAIDPERLRDLVKEVIERHMPPARYEELMGMEKRDKQLLKSLQVVIKDITNHLA
jgi:hypothetical protein